MDKIELQQFELKDRHLYLFGDIDNDMAYDIIKSINNIILKDKDINIRLKEMADSSLIFIFLSSSSGSKDDEYFFK